MPTPKGIAVQFQSARSLLVIAAITAPTLFALAGCEADSLKKVEQGESVFAFLTPVSPVEAAQAMVDPYDADKRFRGTAMIAHAPFGGEDVYVKIYADHVQNDTDMGVRAVSARALGLHGKPEHAPLIAPLLKSPDRTVRLEAARALQRLHNPAVVDALVEAAAAERLVRGPEPSRTGEVDAQVRAEACTALGQYAQPKVLNALIDGVDDDQLVVNKAARESLKVLTGQDFGEDRRAWLTWLKGTPNPFAMRGEYTYPAFSRDKRWFEHIPFVPPPPNEVASTPAGLSAAPKTP